MSSGLIYCATSPSNKKYIGKTVCSLQDRIKKHYSSIRYYDHKFYRALKKYKREDFVWEVLYDNVPTDILDIAEICVIYVYGTMHHGYNSTSGGDGPVEVSKETRKKMSESMRNKKVSLKTRKRLSEALIGNRNAAGRVVSEETRKKISRANLGKKHSEETKKQFSLMRKVKRQSLETIRKAAQARIGRKVGKKTRDKIGSGNAKNTYKVIRIDGTYDIVNNLSAYCRENGLCVSSLVAVSKGKREHHKGLICTNITKEVRKKIKE